MEILEHVVAEVERTTEEMREGRRKEWREGLVTHDGSSINYLWMVRVK